MHAHYTSVSSTRTDRHIERQAFLPVLDLPTVGQVLVDLAHDALAHGIVYTRVDQDGCDSLGVCLAQRAHEVGTQAASFSVHAGDDCSGNRPGISLV